MSGEKRTRVQILQDQMKETTRQLYNAGQQRERLREEIGRMKKDNSARLDSLRAALEERDRKMKATTDSLQSEMRNLAAEHQKQLSEQRNGLMQEMQHLEARTDEKVDNLRNWTQQRLDQQRQQQERITRRQQQQINDLKAGIENINRKEQNRAQRAAEYLHDFEKLTEAADTLLPHDRFAPGRMQKIRRQLEAARLQFNQDAPEATIATIQRAHFDLMDLEEDVLALETEFEMTYRTVADSIGTLYTVVRQNRQIKLEENAPLQEADYWTEGRYQELEERIRQQKEHIENNKMDLTTAELNSYLDDIENGTRQQEDLVQESVERIISSQMRAEMGDTVIRTLGEQGYVVKKDARGYSGEDQREAYMIKLTNTAGTEIVTVISPEQKTYENTLSINTYNDETLDDRSRDARNAELLEALSKQGLQTGRTECHEKGVSEYYDVGNLIKQGAGKLPKQVLQTAGGLSGSGNVNPDTGSNSKSQ